MSLQVARTPARPAVLREGVPSSDLRLR